MQSNIKFLLIKMTGNQFGMKGRNLQNYLRYLKANEHKRKELRTLAVMEVKRPLLAYRELSAACSSSLTPHQQRCLPEAVRVQGQSQGMKLNPRTNIALIENLPIEVSAETWVFLPVGCPGRVTHSPVRVFMAPFSP